MRATTTIQTIDENICIEKLRLFSGISLSPSLCIVPITPGVPFFLFFLFLGSLWFIELFYSSGRTSFFLYTSDECFTRNRNEMVDRPPPPYTHHVYKWHQCKLLKRWEMGCSQKDCRKKKITPSSCTTGLLVFSSLSLSLFNWYASFWFVSL